MSKVLNLSLTDLRYSYLSTIAETNGVTVYDVVRQAIDLYLYKEEGFREELRSR